jgi:Rho termination factor, N-terminal domain
MSGEHGGNSCDHVSPLGLGAPSSGSVAGAAARAVWEVEVNMVQKKAATGAKAKARTGVRNKALYKRLRNLGVSAKESARVANSSAKSSRKRASQRGGTATSFANLKVPELRRRAKKAGIKGRSAMNKKQLIRALRAA